MPKTKDHWPTNHNMEFSLRQMYGIANFCVLPPIIFFFFLVSLFRSFFLSFLRSFFAMSPAYNTYCCLGSCLMEREQWPIWHHPMTYKNIYTLGVGCCIFLSYQRWGGSHICMQLQTQFPSYCFCGTRRVCPSGISHTDSAHSIMALF